MLVIFHHISRNLVLCAFLHTEKECRKFTRGCCCWLCNSYYDVPGCREAIEDKKTGILVPLYDQKKLNEAILFFINDPELRNKFGNAAMKHAS